MNVILAFALYVALFLHGFTAPPAVVGQVVPGSPAQAAGIRPGDRIVSINGRPQQDNTKLRMNVALLPAGEPATVVLERAGTGKTDTLQVTPVKNADNFNMPAIGVMPAFTLASGVDAEADGLVTPDLAAMPAGSRVVRVGDADVSNDRDAHVLADALNAAGGRAVAVTLKTADGVERPYAVRPALLPRFSDDRAAFAGLQPRARVAGVVRDGPAMKAGVRADDVIAQIAVVGTDEALRPPSLQKFLEWTKAAGQNGKRIRLTLERDGQTLAPIEIDPTLKLEHKRGIGVATDYDLGAPVVADVIGDSAGARAGVQAGDRVVSVGGKPTAAWPDVLAALRTAGDTAELTLDTPAGPKTVRLALSSDDRAVLASTGFAAGLPLAALTEVRRTSNPIEAAAWGYEETKQSLFQVYVTIRRLFEGSVPLANMSGPVGIFTAGTSAASRGTDMLIWFTALISANLAVVNFLPIPIVDGGLFTFLLMEKVTGRPPSPRVQTAAQIVGILLLGSLFLFVTYHDILRQWG